MPISDRKERKRNAAKDIIDTAEKLIFENGYENITMADIAKGSELVEVHCISILKIKRDIYPYLLEYADSKQNVREYYNRGETGLERLKCS